MKLRNVSPVGHLDVPLLGRAGHPDKKIRTVEDPKKPGVYNEVPLVGAEREGFGCLEPGEVFTVTAEQAALLLPQGANYEPADEGAVKLLAKLTEDAAKATATGEDA